MDEAEKWNQAYTNGLHGKQWDTEWAAPELAGIVAMFGEVTGTAIDIGCGTGADAVYLAECGFNMIGLDISTRALELAAERSARHEVQVDWREGNALDLPVADGSVVAAFDRGCLHHVPPEQHPAYASELVRVLAPGGRAFLRDMSHGGHHKTPVTPTGISELVQGLPLEVVSTVAFGMVGPHRSSPATLAVLRRT